jgi:hypothetical protein
MNCLGCYYECVLLLSYLYFVFAYILSSFVALNAVIKLFFTKIKFKVISFYDRITVMEAAASLKEEIKHFLDSTQVCLDQVKALLGSTVNPSDDTSLAVRLSMVKVCVNIYKCYSKCSYCHFLELF